MPPMPEKSGEGNVSRGCWFSFFLVGENVCLRSSGLIPEG